MQLVRESGWWYDTGSTGGVGLEEVVASGGLIVLKDPAGKSQNFHYGGVGVGPSVKLDSPFMPKLAWLPEIFPQKGGGPSVTGSAMSFPSFGTVYITSAFRGTELTRSNIQGVTVFIDMGAGVLVAGVSATLMLLGIPSALVGMAAATQNAVFFEDALECAPAALIMIGVNSGLQGGAVEEGTAQIAIGAGAGILMGYLH